MLLLLSDAGEERESNSDDGWLVATDNPEVELAVELGDDRQEDIGFVELLKVISKYLLVRSWHRDLTFLSWILMRDLSRGETICSLSLFPESRMSLTTLA